MRSFSAFRDDCLSLIPVEEDRRRSTQSHPHKSVTISWDLVGGIDYYHTSPSKRSLKIIWLPMPPELFAKQLQCLQYIEYLKSVNISTGKKSSKKGFTSSSSSISLFSMGKKSSSMKLTESHSTMTFKPDDKSEMRPYPEGIEKFQPKDLIHGYERLSWKTLNIETTDDEAWKIGEKLSDIIDQRKSPIRQIFQHSNSGEHRPSSAAETAFRLRNLSYISQNIRQQDEASSSGHKTHRRRFSVNPMPMLNKILSRNE
uniref:Uncharacterized protein n=1 Tax=Bursaphelenchus xylophilus TaxID=6326 RepID=A0A1I7RYM6_BURXY